MTRACARAGRELSIALQSDEDPATCASLAPLIEELGFGTISVYSDLPPFAPTEGTSATVRELEHMEAFGLAPRDALHAATLGPAAWLGIDDEVGSVDAGKRADLIATREDPTASVSALRTLHWVMKDGNVYRDDAWVR